MGQVVAAVGVPAVKGEFQHLHAGETAVFQQLPHGIGEEAQVLGDDGLGADGPLHRPEQLHPRAFLPHATAGVRVSVGDGVIGVKAPEMVDAQPVIHPAQKADPPGPPGVVILRHPVPVEQGVPPQLARLGKAVGWAARHFPGHMGFIQLEQLRVRPHIHAVQRHIDGQVADEFNAPAVGVGAQLPPLGEEQILHRAPEVQIPGVLPAEGRQGLRVPVALRLRPVQPGRTAVAVLQGHEQGVILQPEGIFPAEVPEIFRG